MAEGFDYNEGTDGEEMGERGERIPEYSLSDDDDLDTERNRLLEIREGDDGYKIARVKLSAIDNELSMRGEISTDMAETDFGGRVEDDAYAQLEKFVFDTSGVRLNHDSDSVLAIRNRIYILNGNIMSKEMLDSGEPSKKDKMVLKRVGGSLTYNESASSARTVAQFKALLDAAVGEARGVDAAVENNPMIVDEGSSLPPTVFNRLSEADRRVVNGVFIGLSEASRMGFREEHLRVEVNKYRVKTIHTLDAVRNEPNEVKAGELYQKTLDYESVVEAIEGRIELEKNYGEQVEDITKLQKVKKWLKENMVGLSAIGITVASLVTTIIIGMRTVITKGAQATQSFAKAVKDAIAKLGPWAAGLANLVYTIIKAGASAISFLARNLWIIAIAVSYFLWEM